MGQSNNVAVTHIHSLTTLQDWNNNNHFYSTVSTEETYIFPHPFVYEAWDTVTIGFIKNIHANHYPKDLLKDQLYDMLKEQDKTPPQFQLIPQQIKSSNYPSLYGSVC